MSRPTRPRHVISVSFRADELDLIDTIAAHRGTTRSAYIAAAATRAATRECRRLPED